MSDRTLLILVGVIVIVWTILLSVFVERYAPKDWTGPR